MGFNTHAGTIHASVLPPLLVNFFRGMMDSLKACGTLSYKLPGPLQTRESGEAVNGQAEKNWHLGR